MADTKSRLGKNIATKLADLRRKKGLSQNQLAKLANIPRSTVSVLESGSANPSINTLYQIAEVLGCKIEELLTPSRSRFLHIKNENIPSHSRSKKGLCIRKLVPDNIPHLDFEEVILEAGVLMIGSPHSAGTKEYLYCTKGSVLVNLQGEEHEILKGDVLTFPGSIQHSYRNPTKSECRFISLVALAPLF